MKIKKCPNCGYPNLENVVTCFKCNFELKTPRRIKTRKGKWIAAIIIILIIVAPIVIAGIQFNSRAKATAMSFLLDHEYMRVKLRWDNSKDSLSPELRYKQFEQDYYSFYTFIQILKSENKSVEFSNLADSYLAYLKSYVSKSPSYKDDQKTLYKDTVIFKREQGLSDLELGILSSPKE